jgi:cytochrome P450
MPSLTIPKAQGLPLVGVALKFGPEWALAMRDRHGDVFALDLPAKNGGVMVVHPDDVRAALTDRKDEITRQAFPNGPDDLLARATGDGIITRSGPAWVERRAMMQPSFRRQRLDELVPLMLGEIDRVLDSLDRRFVQPDRAFDALPEMNRVSMGVLIRTLFSTGVSDRDFETACDAVDLTMKSLSFSPFVLGKRRMYERASRAFEEVTHRLITARRQTPPEERPRDLLTAMLEMKNAKGEGLGDGSLRFELIGLLIAGKETAAITLSWLLGLLERMPEVKRRLIDEIDKALGGRPPAAEDLPKLRYVRMVLQETLRRHTPVWVLFPREAASDVTLGGHTVPKGTRIWISPYATHHHPDFWPRAAEFDPERFAGEGEEASLPHRYAYLPFGGGPRVCLGARFAMMEMELFVARLFQRYTVRWAGTKAMESKVVFNTYLPKEVPLRLVPRA